MKKISAAILIFYLFTVNLIAQTPTLSNQGTLFSVKDAAFVSVHGNLINNNGGFFHNSDTIHLFGNWENNAGNEAFTSTGEGVVTLRGENQFISGTNITRFYDLRLENTGIKYGQGIDIAGRYEAGLFF